MKVVEGNFGDAQEPPTLNECLKDVMEVTDLGETKGRFVLIVDTDDRMSFMTNEKNPAGVVYLMEQVKHAILMGGVAQYD